MKKFFLLLDQLTYIPVPKKLTAPLDQFPKALRYLPLLGLLIGAVLYFTARLVTVMPASGGAAVLLGMHLLCGGARLLRDLMTVASGISVDPLYSDENTKPLPPTNPDNEKELTAKAWRFNTSRAGLVWGGIWIAALYFLYLVFLTSDKLSEFVFICCPVISYWLMSWLIYYFYAVPPAWLHRNFRRRDFVVSSVLALVSICFFSSPALYIAVMTAFLGIYIFGTYRQRTAGGLDDVCYGAACAWAHVLFLLAWFTCDRFI